MKASVEEGIYGGRIHLPGKEVSFNEIAWVPHSSYPGVWLKHLARGADTDNQFSLHLVKVGAGFELREHQHDSNWELHQVLCGVGEMTLNLDESRYNAGVFSVIPQGTKHRVSAEGEDLYLLATFVPPLL